LSPRRAISSTFITRFGMDFEEGCERVLQQAGTEEQAGA
jgi:hypothetical protein